MILSFRYFSILSPNFSSVPAVLSVSMLCFYALLLFALKTNVLMLMMVLYRQCQHCSIVLLSLFTNKGPPSFQNIQWQMILLYHYTALPVFTCRRPSSWQMRMLRWSLCGLPCGAALWYPKKSMRDVNVVSPLCLGNHRYVISNSSCLIRVIFDPMSFYSCCFMFFLVFC